MRKRHLPGSPPKSPGALRPPRLRLAVVALVMGAALLTSLGVLRVARRHQVVRVGYELTEATSELRRLREENRQLRLEKSVLTNPARIERLARSLGMQRPVPDQIRTHSEASRDAAQEVAAGP